MGAGVEARKLQLVGNRSFSVSLPKDWVKKNDLGKQDEVFIEATDNNELLIKTVQAQKKEQAIAVNADHLENIEQFLVFCYMKNINHIRLTSKRMEYEVVKKIHQTVRYLEGYDISSESDQEIEISFLFHDININMSKILHRIIYLLRMQITCLEKRDHKVLAETEMAIDRLYHLSKRILFACIHNYRMREQNNIMNEEELFFLRDIMKKLENIADNIYSLSKIRVSPTDLGKLRDFTMYLDAVIKRQIKPADLQRKLEQMSLNSPNNEVQAALERIHALCMDIFENFISIEFDRTYFS